MDKLIHPLQKKVVVEKVCDGWKNGLHPEMVSVELITVIGYRIRSKDDYEENTSEMLFEDKTSSFPDMESRYNYY